MQRWSRLSSVGVTTLLAVASLAMATPATASVALPLAASSQSSARPISAPPFNVSAPGSAPLRGSGGRAEQSSPGLAGTATASTAIPSADWPVTGGTTSPSGERPSPAAPAAASPAAIAAPTSGLGIDTSDPATVLAAWQAIVATSPSMGFTGNVSTCDAGTTSPAYRAAELKALNAFRALVGVAAASGNTAWSAQAQQSALMTAAQQQLSHAPQPPWNCFNAVGANAASKSDLFLGAMGVDAIWGYIADWGDNNLDAGHRRWLFCPGSTEFGFGDVPGTATAWGSNSTKVFDSATPFTGPSRDGFIAWPNPGIVPLNYALSRSLLDRFSVQVPITMSASQAAVSVTSSNGDPVPVTVIDADDLNYCSPAVVFEPSRMPTVGETWTVTVTGITENHEPVQNIVYTSTFQHLTLSDAFVKAAYTDLIGRMPTANELSVHSGLLDDGDKTRADLATLLVNSNEWLAHLVTGFYVNTLGRQPDSAGAAYWIQLLASGSASVASVAALFYASPEYFQRIGSGDTGRWIDDLYLKLLDRTSDPSGRAYWVAQAVTVGRAQVAYSFYQSLESRQARVTALYAALLGRSPDNGGRDYWADRLRSGSDLALAVNLVSSAEYQARAQTRF